MTKKIKKGYDWAEEQQEKWEMNALEKIEQLDKSADSHLDWFNKHSTISEILAWKRPDLDMRKNTVSKDESRSDNHSKPIINILLLDQDSPPKTKVNDNDPVNEVNESSQPITNHKDQGSPQQNNDSAESLAISYDDDEVMLRPLPEITESINSTKNSTIANDQESVTPSRQSEETNELQQVNENSVVEMDEPEAHDMQQDESIDIAPDIGKTIKHNKISLSKSKRTKPIVINSDDTVLDRPSLDNSSEVPMAIEKTASPIPPPTQVTRSGLHSITGWNRRDNSNNNMTTTTTTNTSVNITMPAVVDEPICTPELIMDVDSQKATQNDSDMEEEVEDEVQLVISNRQDDEIQLVASKSNLDKDVKMSPVRITTAQPTTNTSPVPPVRYPSPFMSNLFKMGGPARSLKANSPLPTNFITTRPKPSESTSSITSEMSNNLEMSLLDNNKKRPLESAPKSVTSEIEVSDFMPQSRFKKSKAMAQGKSKASIPAPQNKKSNSVDNEVESNNEVEDKEDEEPETTYLIPSWAKSPELSAQLRNQAGLDPDRIFGSVAPLKIDDIFADRHAYLPIIPEQAPS